MLHLSKNTSSASKSDGELLESYRQTGDMAAIGMLFDRYIPLLYGLCLKYLKNEADAKDSVMQIFEETAEKVLRYDIQVFKSWLYVLGKNHCLMRLRKQPAGNRLPFEEKFMEFTDEFHLDKVMEDERKLQALNECIDLLPPHQKEAVVQFFMEARSYREVSNVTGNDLHKVKSFIQNGKRNLKICMENKHVMA